MNSVTFGPILLGFMFLGSRDGHIHNLYPDLHAKQTFPGL